MCFLAFAPPGTLVLGVLVALTLFGEVGLTVAAVSLVSLAVILILIRLLNRNSEGKSH